MTVFAENIVHKLIHEGRIIIGQEKRQEGYSRKGKSIQNV